ncbi:MAG: sugar phosphate isomerase/epimerase family protein [Thermomicrobiales bacterium]
MTNALIGCGQLTWNPEGKTPQQVLQEIAKAGYDGAPAPAADPKATAELFSAAGLKPAPGYLGAKFWELEATDDIVAQARDIARSHRQLGLTELYVAANLIPERRTVSGHVSATDALSDEGYATFVATLNAVGHATREFGVATCFHNHVGSYIETRAELDHLFSLVDRDVVFLGIDLGHLAWAGDDVVSCVRDYRAEIKTFHIKDINPDVLAEGVAKKWDYATFSEHGIFTELGTGFVDLKAAVDELGGANFPGWIIVETDVTQLPTALESAEVSRAYLRGIGL